MNKLAAQQVRAYTDSRQDQIIDLIKELVMIESPTLQTLTHSKIHDISYPQLGNIPVENKTVSEKPEKPAEGCSIAVRHNGSGGGKFNYFLVIAIQSGISEP